jgi:hypothetical protein
MQIGQCVCSGVYTCLGSNSNIGMINFAFFFFQFPNHPTLYVYSLLELQVANARDTQERGTVVSIKLNTLGFPNASL